LAYSEDTTIIRLNEKPQRKNLRGGHKVAGGCRSPVSGFVFEARKRGTKAGAGLGSKDRQDRGKIFTLPF